jgi:hypothetical protein
VPTAKAPTKAESCFAVFDEVGVDAPMPRLQEALAAKGVKVSDNYVYDLKKVYRKRKGAVGGTPSAPRPARKGAPARSPARKTAPAQPAKPASAPVVEAVQTAQHLLALVGKADALRLLTMLATEPR